MLIVFIYVYLCQTQFPFHMMFVSFNSKMMGTTRGAEIDPSRIPLVMANEAGRAQHRIPQPCAAGNCGV